MNNDKTKTLECLPRANRVRLLASGHTAPATSWVDGMRSINPADWYVRKILGQAEKYRAAQQDRARAGAWVIPQNRNVHFRIRSRDGEFHRGQDIAAPVGTPIVAASSDTVIDAGPASGYGLWIRIQHPDHVVTTYGHNHRNHVHVGQNVHAGQPIAAVGNRGESTGPHLHFQLE